MHYCQIPEKLIHFALLPTVQTSDISGLGLLWEILNHLDTIKVQRQAEKMLQTMHETSVLTDSHETHQGVGDPMNGGSLDSKYSPIEKAIDVGNNMWSTCSLKEVLRTVVALTPAFHQQKMLAFCRQDKEDEIDVGKERVTKPWQLLELELRESYKKQILEGKGWMTNTSVLSISYFRNSTQM